MHHLVSEHPIALKMQLLRLAAEGEPDRRSSVTKGSSAAHSGAIRRPHQNPHLLYWKTPVVGRDRMRAGSNPIQDLGAREREFARRESDLKPAAADFKPGNRVWRDERLSRLGPICNRLSRS